MRIRSSLIVVMLAGCVAPAPAPPAKPFGLSIATAVEVCHPAGERAYLSRLRCDNGERLTIGQRANVGWRNQLTNGGGAIQPDPYAKLPPGASDAHVIDAYGLSCGTASRPTIYLDMYHCDVPPPDVAPPGFTIVPAPAPTPRPVPAT